MKKHNFYFIIVLFIIIANSCKKDPAIKNSTPSNVPTTSVTPTQPIYYSFNMDGRIIDTITNIPIPNKTVSLIQEIYDPEGLTLEKECIFSVVTDSLGKFKISTSSTQSYGSLELNYGNGDDYYNWIMEGFGNGTTHFGDIYLTPILHLRVKLSKTGVFNITDTLFLNVDNQKYFFLYYQQNDSIDLGIRRSNVWAGAEILLNWNFKTLTSVTSNNDSAFCKANVKTTYVLHY